MLVKRSYLIGKYAGHERLCDSILIFLNMNWAQPNRRSQFIGEQYCAAISGAGEERAEQLRSNRGPAGPGGTFKKEFETNVSHRLVLGSIVLLT